MPRWLHALQIENDAGDRCDVRLEAHSSSGSGHGGYHQTLAISNLQHAKQCYNQHSIITVVADKQGSKFFTAKNWKIHGPIAAKNRQIRDAFAVVIIAIQNSQILLRRSSRRTSE